MTTQPYQIERTDSAQPVDRAHVVIVIPDAGDPIEQSIADILGALEASDILASAPTSRDADRAMVWNGQNFVLAEITSVNLSNDLDGRLLPPPDGGYLFLRTDATGGGYQLAALRVEDLPGDITLDKLKSDGRLTAGQFLTVNSRGDGLAGVIAPTGGEGGLTLAQVNAAIAAYIAANPPTAGLTLAQVNTAIADYLAANPPPQVAAWAVAGNAQEIPDAKIRLMLIDGRVQAYKATTSPRTPAALPEATAANALTGGWDLSEDNWSDAGHAHGMTEHQQFVFNAFKGGQWDSRAETYLTAASFAARPAIGTLTALAESGWSVTSTGGDGSRRENQYWGIRIPLTTPADEYSRWRTWIDFNDGADVYTPLDEADYIGEDSEYKYFAQQFADKPAGDSVYLQSRVPYQLDGEIVTAVADGEITPPKLAGALPANAIPQVSADGTTFVRAAGGAHLTTFLDGVRINPDRAIPMTNSLNGYRSALLSVAGFDLDDHMAGQVTVEAVWHIVTTGGEGDTEIAFTEAGATADDYETYEGTLATTIANSPAYVPATLPNVAQGVHVGTFMLWRGNDQLGTGRLYLTRDGNNAVSAFWQYIGAAGNYSATIRCTLTVSIIENDGGVSGGAVGGIVSITQTDYDALAAKDPATLYLISG